MWRKIADRSLKVLICFGLVLMLNLSLKPKQEVSACGPCVFLLPVIEMVVVDIALELGFKFIVKPAWKTVKTKLAKEIFANKNSFDFVKGKVNLTKDGKVSLPSLTKKDKAKIASLLAKEGTKEVVEKSVERDKKSVESQYIYEKSDVKTDPFYMTGLKLTLVPNGDTQSNHEAFDFMKKFLNVHYVPIAYKSAVYVSLSNAMTGEKLRNSSNSSVEADMYRTYMPGGSPYASDNLRAHQDNYSFNVSVGGRESYSISKSGSSARLWESYKHAISQNRATVHIADGLVVPEIVKQVYDVPFDTPKQYILPNEKDLGDGWDFDSGVTRDTDLTIDLTKTDIDIEVLKPEIERITEVIENEMDLSLSNYTFSSSTVNYQVNNYYNDSGYDKSVEEVENEIEIYIENNPVIAPIIGGGGGYGDLTPVDDPIDTPKSFFTSIYVVGQYLADVYKGVTSFMTGAVDGFKELGEGTVGLVKFLDDFFDWLPKEYVTLLSSALMLGVVAFFLRR